MNLLLVTILPSIVILLYFIYSDKFKEPKNLIIKVFLFGVLTCFPAGYLNYFSEILIPQTELGERLSSSSMDAIMGMLTVSLSLLVPVSSLHYLKRN